MGAFYKDKKTFIKGQFRSKVETILDNNSRKYDDI